MGLNVYDYQDFLDKGWRRSGHWLYKVRVPAAAPTPAQPLHPWAPADSGRAALQPVLAPPPPPPRPMPRHSGGRVSACALVAWRGPG